MPPVAPPVTRNPDQGDALVVERRKQRLEPPRMYQVVMLNDDFTPMEFVIVVLQEFFGKDRETATRSCSRFTSMAVVSAASTRATLPQPR